MTTNQQALNLLARKLTGRRIINPGGAVGARFAELSNRYFASGQNIKAIPGLREAINRQDPKNPNFNQPSRFGRREQRLTETQQAQRLAGQLEFARSRGRNQSFQINSEGKTFSVRGKDLDKFLSRARKIEALNNLKVNKVNLKKLIADRAASMKTLIPDIKTKALAAKYKNDISSAKARIARAVRNKEIQRTAELQRKKNLTTKEREELRRIKNNTANNFKLVSDILWKTAFTTVVDAGYGSVTLAKQLKNAPLTTFKALPPAVWDGLKSDFRRVTRGGAIEAAQVATEYAVFAGALKGVGATAKGSLRVASRLNPKFVRLKQGQFKFRGKPDLTLKTQTVASGAQSLKQQAGLAGKSVTAVNASADRLTSLIRRKKIIRKPIPGEENAPTSIKKILKKFDEGRKITFKELQTANIWLRKNIAPNITLLERSLYLDPASGLRVSRLGITKPPTATFKDILRGNFRLWQKAQRPQVLIFENAQVARFPKALKDIERKLKAGKKLTTKETDRLVQWQIEAGSGRFKPIGSTIYAGGLELEVTLAPGELIKRIKRIGFTFIEGKKVDFVLAKVYQPSKAVVKDIKLAQAGKLQPVKLKSLEKKLSRDLGRKVKVETPDIRLGRRRLSPNTPVLRLRGRGIAVVRARARARPTKRARATPRSPPRKRAQAKRAPRRTTGRAPRPAPKRPARTRPKPRPSPKRAPPRRVPPRKAPPRKPPKRPPRIIPKPSQFKKQTLKRAVPTYYVVTKKRGKLVRLFPKPLTLNAAKDYAIYSIDNNLTKTAFYVPLRKTKQVTTLPRGITGYFSKAKAKVRPYRIKMGKKKQLVNGYIEKRKFFQDTKGERLQAARLRKKALKKKVVRKKVKKRKVVKKKRRTKKK